METASTLTWLHLSDVHCGNPKFDWDSEVRFTALFKDLECAIRRFDLRPDLIFFTGDLVFGRVPKSLTMKRQYENFNRFLEKVRNSFSPAVPKKSVFFVPGNHDINRDKVSPDETKWLHECKDPILINEMLSKKNEQCVRYFSRLSDYRKFLAKNNYKHLLEDRDRLVYTKFINIRDLKISVSGLNTAWSSSTDREKGKLWLGIWQLREIISQARKADIRILLSHHPTGWFTESEDNSVAREIETNFHFYLHGHEHSDWVTSINGCMKISCGTCYKTPDKISGYNMVRLYLRDRRGDVYLRSFDDKGGGWIPRLVYSKTSSQGIWPLNNLPIVIKSKPPGSKIAKKRARIIKIPNKQLLDIYEYFTVAKAQEDQNLFVGRKDELAIGVGALKAPGASIAIYGKAGVGKSSLGLQIAHIACGRHLRLLKSLNLDQYVSETGFTHPVVYYTCKKNVDYNLSNLFLSIMVDRTPPFSLGDILSQDEIKDDLKKDSNLLISSQLHRIYEVGRTSETINFSTQLCVNLFALITKIWNNIPIVVVLDEYDVVADKTGLATILKNCPFIKFVLVGTAVDVRLLVQEHASIPRQIIEGQINVKPMTEKECLEIIQKESMRSSNLFKFTTEASNELALSARGMPFFIHFFGRYSLDAAIKRLGHSLEYPIDIEKIDVSSAMEKRLKSLADIDATYLDITKGDWKKECIINLMSFRKEDDINIKDISNVALRMGIPSQVCTKYVKRLSKENHFMQTAKSYFQFADTRLKVFSRLRIPITIEAQKKLRHFIQSERFKSTDPGWLLPPHL